LKRDAGFDGWIDGSIHSFIHSNDDRWVERYDGAMVGGYDGAMVGGYNDGATDTMVTMEQWSVERYDGAIPRLRYTDTMRYDTIRWRDTTMGLMGRRVGRTMERCHDGYGMIAMIRWIRNCFTSNIKLSYDNPP
jgi:hypothetical protein